MKAELSKERYWMTRAGRAATLLVAVTMAGPLSVSPSKAASNPEQAPTDSAGAPAPHSRPPGKGLQATSMTRTDYGVAVVQYWSLGPRLRAEAVVSGHNVVTVVNGAFYYAYDSLEGRGYRIRRSRAAIEADGERLRPFGLQLQEILAEGGEKIREETFEGIPVDVYRVTDDEGRRTLRVPTGDPNQIPISLETYNRSRGHTVRLDWINWLTGMNVPESFFMPPPNVELEEFESYDDYRIRLAEEGPIPPALPFFKDLLVSPGE